MIDLISPSKSTLLLTAEPSGVCDVAHMEESADGQTNPRSGHASVQGQGEIGVILVSSSADLNGGGASGNASSAIHGAGGIGGLLGMECDHIAGFAEPPKFLYFFDGNGNVGQLVAFDAGVAAPPPAVTPQAVELGVALSRYEYDPFGGTLVASDELGLENPFRFSTKYYDAQPSAAAAGERGLYYYGYRYYSPRLGRWMTRDPIGVNGGQNVFRFITNSPQNNIDVRGLYEKDVHEFLTKFLAEAAGLTEKCALNPSSIGHETQAVDEDPDREPMRFLPPVQGINQRRDYHFTTVDRRQTMLAKALASCDPRDIGEFIHALQDSYSHQKGKMKRFVRHEDVEDDVADGVYYPKFGHARNGHHPDWTWERPELANQMAKDTYDHLKLIGKKCGCCGVKKNLGRNRVAS